MEGNCGVQLWIGRDCLKSYFFIYDLCHFILIYNFLKKSKNPGIGETLESSFKTSAPVSPSFFLS